MAAPSGSSAFIRIRPITHADLPTIYLGNDEAFPPFWDMVEVKPRPPLEQRQRAFCKRWSKLIDSPDVWARVAVDTQPGNNGDLQDGQLAGITIWHKPGSKIFNRKRWQPDDLDETAWIDVDKPAWERIWGSWDATRQEIIDTFPHWYLAPIWIRPGFKRKGVGRKLMMEAIEQADRDGHAIYLEASDEGVNLYKALDFVVEREGQYTVMIRWPGGAQARPAQNATSA